MAGALRATATAGNGSTGAVSPLTISVPTSGAGGTVVAGDYALLAVNSSQGGMALITPSGWSLLQTGVAGQTAWLFGKTLVAGDVGASVSLAFGSATRCTASMVIGSGVTATGMASAVALESSNTTTPTLPSLTGVAAGSLVVTFLSRRTQGSPAATVTPPVAFSPLPSTATAIGSNPEQSLAAGVLVQPSAGSAGGVTGSSSPATAGVNFLAALPATVAGGSGVTVTGATMTGSGVMPAGTVSTATSSTSRPNVLTQLWRSGGHEVTYTVAASYGGVPVQGAQALQPTGGQITDTNKAGVRRTLNLELAREVVGGQFLEDLLVPEGTTLAVTAHVTANSVPVADIPMGVFDVDDVDMSEGYGKIIITAPDKWQRIVRSRFLRPQPSQQGYPVTQQITWLIQDALGAGETVLNLASSSAQVGTLTWDRDRDKTIQQLAASIGAWVYFDRIGQATIADIPQIGAQADWLVDSGTESSVMISVNRSRSRQGTYNVVVVSSSASAGEAFRPVLVFDRDINSPTYAGTDPLNRPGEAGPFGVVPVFYSSPILGSEWDALVAGTAILARTVGLASQVSLSAVPNPQVDSWDVIDVLPPKQPWAPDRVFERHVVDTVVHPLSLDGSSPMTITGRSTRADPYVSDVTA